MAYAIKKSFIDDYYNWVISELGVRKRVYSHYKKLLKTLFKITYVWTVEFDENRYADGMSLRYHFCQDNDLSDLQWKDFYLSVYFPCSVLEVLTAFSKRIADSPYTYNDFSGMMFWIFMENLGLMIYTDENFDEEAVIETVNCWMTGQNEVTILPISSDESDKSDKSDMDLWRIMTIYMYEHPELAG